MRLKIAQFDWPIGANDLSGTGEWAIGDCKRSDLTPIRSLLGIQKLRFCHPENIQKAGVTALPNRLF